MALENFPEIEAFQKLPKRVIVKGGLSAVREDGHAELSGIVINNAGQPIKSLKVFLILFDERGIPILNSSVGADPAKLSQGGVASFKFSVNGYGEKINNHYLYPNWQYDDSQWV
jgi:hypothetical protein